MAGAQLSDAEIARRLPVWTALSDVFLDTELDPQEYSHIADVIRQSGYAAGEAEAIFRDEVAPAFSVNLRSVAGEWQGWPEDYVRDRVLARRGAMLAKLSSRLFHRSFLNEQWALIARHLR
ncbi:MAG: hypothetical protein KJ872_07815 [Alphaproteobacteria bacterium]|nr:hypothetical protein [Alphaproteobacteria bacterium]